MILCEECGKILLQNTLDRVLLDRERAIKRMNQRSNHAIKKENTK